MAHKQKLCSSNLGLLIIMKDISRLIELYANSKISLNDFLVDSLQNPKVKPFSAWKINQGLQEAGLQIRKEQKNNDKNVKI